MKKYLVAIVVVLISVMGLKGQSSGTTTSLDDDNSTPLISKEFRPSIGVGLGLFNYFGDVNSRKIHNSFVNQMGLNLHVSRKIKDYADLGFSFITGNISGNERSAERNLNFKSTIFSGSVYINYNFYHLLPEASVLQPYVSLGLNFFEYNSKGDLFDINGNKYHYWSDGSIRNLEENSPLASSAITLQRDYHYETDLREANLDGFGKYPQIGFGIPFGIGASFNITDRVNFKIGSTMHFTFTDLLDNVSDESVGSRAGNKLNDHFLFNSFTIHYDLLNAPKRVNPEDFHFPDFFAVESVDGDQDGVLDAFDECPETPEGVKVDAKGCAIDSDGDGVPDYKDVENNTQQGAFADADGKTLTDKDFQEWYMRYIDSLDVPEEILNRIAGNPIMGATYRILVGEFKGKVPEDLLKLYMQEKDIIGALSKDNKTAYLAGKYGNLDVAKARRKTLLEKGFPQATIVVWDDDTQSFIPYRKWEEKAKEEIKEKFGDKEKEKENLNGFYAVQLGKTPADANSADKAKFYEQEDVVALPGDRNSTDYVVGPFIDSVSAKQRLSGFNKDKYPNARVVKVEQGKIKDTGITTKNVKYDPNQDKQEKKNKLKEKLASIQDAFVIELPTGGDDKTKKAIEKIKETTDVIEVKNKETGKTSLVAVDPKSLADAKKEVEKLQAQGVNAKVGQVKDGKVSSLKEAVLNADPKLASKEGEYVVKVADSKDPGTKELLNKLRNDPSVEEIKNADNTSTFISVDPKSLFTAKKEVEKLKEEGFAGAEVNQVKDGKLVPIESSLRPNKAKNPLADKEGSFVVQIADTKDPGTKSLVDKLRNDPKVQEVKNKDNSSTFISVDPKSLAQAKQEAKKLKEEGYTNAEVKQVKNGTLTDVPASGSTSASQDNPLAKLEGEYVVNFGDTKDPATQKIIEKIKQQPGVKEIKNSDNSSTFISVDPKSLFTAKKEVEELKKQGINSAKVSQVKNGEIIDAEETTTVASNPEKSSPTAKSADLSKMENQFIVKLDKINDKTASAKREKLLKEKNIATVKNPDGSIDVISDKGFKSEGAARKLKKQIADLGYKEAKIAKVKNGKIEELSKEKLDGNYAISLGKFGDDVSQEEINKILSEPDVESIDLGNETVYLIGNYADSTEAMDRFMELAKNGHSPEIVKFQNGKMDKVQLDKVFSKTQMQTIEELKKVGDILHTDEISYRVQVGAYRQKIPKSVFQGMQTLAIPAKGGVTKYVTGSFGTYKQAYIHKLTLWKMGFKGAFVVAYKDGKRIKVTDLVNQNEFKNVQKDVKPVAESNDFVPVKKKETKPTQAGVSYRVQLAAIKEGTKEPEFNEFPDAEMEVYGEYKRYLTGSFKTYREANAHKEKAKKLGFGKAFVVAYNNGKRVAAPGENPNVIKVATPNATETRTVKKLLVLVQIGLFRGDLPEEVKQKFSTLPNITKQVTPQGITRWMTGNFKNPAEAAAYKEKLIAQGFADAFVVAYYNNERIKVSEAVKIWEAGK